VSGAAAPTELAALTEAVEAISRRYAANFGIARTGDWFVLKVQEELGELTQAYLALTGQSRRQGAPETLHAAFEDEVADLLCQLLLLARHHRVDLPTAIGRKWLRWAEA
jgi:NTP pyrophosphatase (non-canonical NTP hydrolase)